MKQYPGVSKFVVHYVSRRGPYKGWTIKYTYFKARIMRNGRAKCLGHFQTPQEAHVAYLRAKQKGTHNGL